VWAQRGGFHREPQWQPDEAIVIVEPQSQLDRAALASAVRRRAGTSG